MTKFKVGDRVEITDYLSPDFNGFYGKVLEPLDQYGYIELALESVPVGYSEEWQTGSFYVSPNEITLAKQETEVTEFRKGDKVRVIRRRNAPGTDLAWDANKIGKILTISGDHNVNEGGLFGIWKAYLVEEYPIWVRSDDIELVSRDGEEKINWEEELFGTHYTEYAASKFKISRHENGEDVTIKIPKNDVWTPCDLEELGIHLLTLAEYLETGTVDLSDEGECLACENEDLKASNERLVSANEAKRERLAKIKDLATE